MALLSSQAALFHTPRFIPSPSPPSTSSSRFPSCSPISSPASSITLCSSNFKTRQQEQPFTARASLSDSSERIGEVLGDMGVYAATTGEFVKFVDLWDQKEGMAVVALLRHFGCPCCWELALTLKESMSNFDSAGVKLIAVGVGTPDKARILAERLPFPLDRLYADPDRKAYDALGLYYGFGRTFFNPASAKVFSRFDALKKAVKNYTMEATPDDKSSVLQQGGMFVFKGKQLLYSRNDEGTGDHAPLEEVLNICCSASVA